MPSSRRAPAGAPSSASRRARRAFVIGVGACICAAGTDCSAAPASRPAAQDELDRYHVRRDTRITAETTFTSMHGRYALYRVRLASDAGLVVTGRLLVPGRGVVATRRSGAMPVAAAGARSREYAAVLLNDGRELNSRALDYLPPECGDVVVLSLDYPAAFPYELALRDIVLRGGRLRKAAAQVPALFSLGGAYLTQRDVVDPARLLIAATSFAVPFAVAAAAADERFRNVALIYGAGDLAGVLAANLSLRPRFLRPAAAWLATRPFRALEPERWDARIAPRPIAVVDGIDDPQMPRAAVEALYDAAREPKALVWLRTGHLMPDDTALIRTLVDTAFARLPVLRDVDPLASLGVRVPAHHHALAADRRPPQRIEDRLGGLAGDLDERETVGDVDRADRLRIDASLVGDGADEVPGLDVGLPSEPDVEARAVGVMPSGAATRPPGRAVAILPSGQNA